MAVARPAPGPAPDEAAGLRHSPIEAEHLALGAKLVPFGGWEMPLQYPSGTVAEHRACRQDAVVFDVSHLGTVRLTGPEAKDRIQATVTNDLDKIAPGRAQYTHLLSPDGSVADDLIVWWVAPERFDVMPNASNTARVLSALGGTDVTAERAVLAVQGPRARAALTPVVPEAAEVGRFKVAPFSFEGVTGVAAGTGYTGEDGVELAVPAGAARALWRAVVGAGVRPAGLGARDTLRLEAGLPLHGHELGPGITPLQAGLAWVVAFGKGDFTGRDALVAERDAGPARRLVGLVLDGRQPAREGAPVLVGQAEVGRVTSGNFSPMLERAISLALVSTDAGLDVGDEVALEVRGRHLPARVTPLPFYPPKDAP
jgi:aminomethyltransferase